MKALLFVLSFLISFSALAACPNLSGTYQACESTSGMEMFQLKELSMSQSNHTFTIKTINVSEATDTSLINADGKARSQTMNQGPTTYTMNIKAQCSSKALTINYKAFGFTEVHTYSKNESGDMVWNVTLNGDQISATTCKSLN